MAATWTEPPRIHNEQSPSLPLPVGSYVMNYETPAPTNQPAVLSLIFGLLLIIPFVPGVLAIVFGRRGLKMATEHAAGRAAVARLGIILGVLNIVLSLAFTATLPMAYMRSRRAAMMIQCASNLRTIGVSAMLYANANRGFLPPTIDDVATMMPAGATGVFVCPACAGNPAKPPVVVTSKLSSHYFYVPPLPQVAKIRQAARTVLAYEPPGHHVNGGMNLLFCDGHVEFVTGPTVPKIVAELQAGTNPPPSIP